MGFYFVFLFIVPCLVSLQKILRIFLNRFKCKVIFVYHKTSNVWKPGNVTFMLRLYYIPSPTISQCYGAEAQVGITSSLVYHHTNWDLWEKSLLLTHLVCLPSSVLEMPGLRSPRLWWGIIGELRFSLVMPQFFVLWPPPSSRQWRCI